MRLKLLSTVFAMMLAAQAAGPQSIRNDAWRVIGPGGGGYQVNPAVSPHDPDFVVVSCDMTGAYVSLDGGRTWRMFNLRMPVRFFAFDPADSNSVYAYAVGLFRSDDRGGTWRLVQPAPSAVTGIQMPSDHADETLMTAAGPAERMSALAVDPADSRVLYGAFDRGTQSVLRRSDDRGATWSDVWTSTPIRRILIAPGSPISDRTLYVIRENSVAAREAGVWREGPAAPGITAFTDVSAGLTGAGSLIIYGVGPAMWFGSTLGGGIVVSSDGGVTWRSANTGLVRKLVPGGNAPVFAAVATALHDGNVAYLSASKLRVSAAETAMGVLKTTDSGATWEFAWRESNARSPDVDDGWISERFGPGWGANPVAMAVAPTDPNICYATDWGRTLRSTDGGRTWLAVYTQRVPGSGFTTTGLDVTTNYGVHFDPFDPQRVFISYTDIGLFGSEDGGVSWKSFTTGGVPSAWVNTTYWIEFDAEVRGRMWAAMSGTHDLPRPKMWRGRPVSAYVGGVARSDDGGHTWIALNNNGLPPTAATHILLDRRSPPGARVLYVAGFGRGVYKSSDGGATWQLKNTGLPASEPFAWRLNQDARGALYLVVSRRVETEIYGTEGDGALFRSTDGAETWEKVLLPEGVNGPNGLAIDPADPNRLYLAAWGRATRPVATGGGIWLSTDAGSSWRQVHARDQHIYDVTIDPRNPSRLYACGFESSVWRSDDRGETWRRLRGYNFKWGHRVIPDPADAERIYVTTFGGSVWHGPAGGDPAAVEDIVTPEVAYSPFGPARELPTRSRPAPPPGRSR